MKMHLARNRLGRPPALLLAALACLSCGDDDNGPNDEQTGTVLQGTVV